jgi:integration host factor subunit beta
MLSMNLSDLIKNLSARQPHLTAEAVGPIVGCILKSLTEAVIQGERIEIRGFGSFTRHRLPPRVSRNPKTGEPVQLPSRSGIRFKPGKELRLRVNKSGFSVADPSG